MFVAATGTRSRRRFFFIGVLVMQEENRSKTCPYCAEQVLAEAKKCKHCGEFLVTVPGRTTDYQWTPGRIVVLIVMLALFLYLMGSMWLT